MSAHQSFQFIHQSSQLFHPKTIGQPRPSVLNQPKLQTSYMGLRTLIVDDEPIARRVLREELELIEDVEIIGEADNGKKALDQIAETNLILSLWILKLPTMGGLEVGRRLKDGAHMPVIVVVTAYDKFAIQAFEAGAIDYLLKPVGQERLAQAVERAKKINGRQAFERIAQLQEIGEPSSPRRTKRIVGRLGSEYFLLSADEIHAFQAEGELVWIITAKRKYLATQTLKVLQERLANTSFRRIHRNALVNVDQVRKMSALSSQRWLITLSNNQEFIASKRQARDVRQLLHW